MIKIKRAYESTERSDGYRVLVDRLWPRGIRKADLPLDEWAKDLAPSTELRRSFGHDPGRWTEFRSRYRRELRAPEARKKLESLAARARRGTVTLVFSARDEDRNNAVVLREVIAPGAVTRPRRSPGLRPGSGRRSRSPRRRSPR